MGKKLKVTLLKSRFNINNLPGSVKLYDEDPNKTSIDSLLNLFGAEILAIPFSGSSTIPEFHTFIILQEEAPKKAWSERGFAERTLYEELSRLRKPALNLNKTPLSLHLSLWKFLLSCTHLLIRWIPLFTPKIIRKSWNDPFAS